MIILLYYNNKTKAHLDCHRPGFGGPPSLPSANLSRQAAESPLSTCTHSGEETTLSIGYTMLCVN